MTWSRNTVWLGLMACLSLPTSCAKRPSTSVTIRAFADAQVHQQKRLLDISISSIDGPARYSYTRMFLQHGATDATILEAQVVPFENGFNGRYRVEVVAYDLDPNEATRVVGRAISGYIPGHNLVLPIYLFGSCAGIVCEDPDTTCKENRRCEGAEVSASILTPYTPLPALDSGLMDSATADSVVSDARATDASDGGTTRDAGACRCFSFIEQDCNNQCTPSFANEVTLEPSATNIERGLLAMNRDGSSILIGIRRSLAGAGGVSLRTLTRNASSFTIGEVSIESSTADCPSAPEDLGWQNDEPVVSGSCQFGSQVALRKVSAPAAFVANIASGSIADYGARFAFNHPSDDSPISAIVSLESNLWHWTIRDDAGSSREVIGGDRPLRAMVGLGVAALAIRDGVRISEVSAGTVSNVLIPSLASAALSRDGTTLLAVTPSETTWRTRAERWQVTQRRDTSILFQFANAQLSGTGSIALASDQRDLYFLRLHEGELNIVALQNAGPQHLARRVIATALSDDGHTAAAMYSIPNDGGTTRIVLWVFAI